MKVCLINPRTITGTELSIPHGLLHISAELKKNGHECRIIDSCNPDYKFNPSELSNCDVVGLSVMSTQLSHAAEIARSIPKRVKVVWGGVHCLLDPLSIVNEFKDHFVVTGEGERPMLELMEYFQGNKDAEWLKGRKGICLHDGNPVINDPYFIGDINELADVDFHDLPQLEKYLNPYNFYFRKNVSEFNSIVARGCLWDCSFCINSIYRKHKSLHRCKDMDKIRRETESVIDEYHIKIVTPRDDDFFANKKLVEQWKLYAAEKNFIWGANCRYNYISEKMITGEKLRDLVDHGLFGVGMSIEAGDETVRNKVINKKIRDSDIVTATEIIRESVGDRLLVNTSFIINFPGDTRDSRIKIIKWMDYLSKNLNIVFSGPQEYRSYPGSKLYESEAKHKYGDFNYYLSNITSSGEFKTAKSAGYESYFYSNLVKGHFNRKFEFYDLTQHEDGKIDWKPSAADPRSLKRKLFNSIMELAFATIKIRLKLNFWALFIEPYLLAFPKKTIDRMRGMEE